MREVKSEGGEDKADYYLVFKNLVFLPFPLLTVSMILYHRLLDSPGRGLDVVFSIHDCSDQMLTCVTPHNSEVNNDGVSNI